MSIRKLSDAELFIAKKFFELTKKLGRTPSKKDMEINDEGYYLLRTKFGSFHCFAEEMNRNHVEVKKQLKKRKWLVNPFPAINGLNFNIPVETRPLYS